MVHIDARTHNNMLPNDFKSNEWIFNEISIENIDFTFFAAVFYGTQERKLETANFRFSKVPLMHSLRQ